jgi:hypothetical protein
MQIELTDQEFGLLYYALCEYMKSVARPTPVPNNPAFTEGVALCERFLRLWEEGHQDAFNAFFAEYGEGQAK